MTTFDKRTEGYENKFAHDAEMQFKVTARRNKLLGLWAAERLTLAPEQAKVYAKSVVEAHIHRASDDDVITKILQDFEAANIASNRQAIVDMLDLFSETAREQIKESS